MTLAKIVPATIIAVLTVASCSRDSGSSRNTSASVDPTVTSTTSEFRPGDMDYFTSKGPIPVMVQGTAFGLDRVTLEKTIANDMQGENWGPDARFASASSMQPNSNREYSVTMALNSAKAVNIDALCMLGAGQNDAARSSSPANQSSNKSTAGSSGRVDIELQAALCHNNKYVRSVSTGADNVSGPNDPAFRKMIRQAITELTSPGGSDTERTGSQQDK